MVDKMNWTPTHLAWVGGLLEGEGCFGINRSRNLRIECKMTDEDVIRRLREITGFGSIRINNKERKPSGSLGKIAYHWMGYGKDAYDLERALFPILGIRRQIRIEETWKIRKEYELATTGNYIRRIFTDPSCQLLPDPA